MTERVHTADKDAAQPELREVFRLQRAGRWLVAQTSAWERRELLKRLYGAIKAQRVSLAAALERDLGKSRAEAETSEIRQVIDEIRHARRHLDHWMQPQRVPTPPTLAGSRSEIRSEALGTVLILSPWNYPFYLTLGPLIGALAAGNSAVLKVSEKAPHTARAIRTLIESVFPPSLVAVVEGGPDTASALLDLPFDHFFFTGGAKVGRLVMEAAARHGAGVTLELGGKSPAIVTRSADLRLAARRIAWAKFLNAGQTCVAPDYVLVPQELEERFLLEVDEAVQHSFGGTSWQRLGPDYGRMIDAAAVERMQALTDDSVKAGARLVTGGEFDAARRFASPTVLGGVRVGMPVMDGELFGPVLPVLPYRHLDDALEVIQTREKPLALYLFAQNSQEVNEVQARTSSGSMVVNGAIIQLTNPNLPFGGVGASGHGSYHGIHGFRTFSHQRAVLYEPALSPVALILPPYGRPAARLTSWALRKLGS
ncbi:aldehyde dehydrogenase family protein [Deinococcus sp. KNUC1210]|uniref:aldehyde dehydrogenase family protein n=1 Tax=Deinococcus sp. KNUC1210 TaxID=2917691 RepID=UPI001EF0FEF2|nr:aldehyde dehydrogenase family protein [Deinococcus sp. KNUC1210]ULH15726.1 aldehyde dehydrogenase family protein [Deinococcus sp. KNUC1210]